MLFWEAMAALPPPKTAMMASVRITGMDLVFINFINSGTETTVGAGRGFIFISASSLSLNDSKNRPSTEARLKLFNSLIILNFSNISNMAEFFF